ncbi:hypothetical protein TRP66_12330 [Pseudomonas sp. JDS28PS106]|uniref:hypothetical protein n=1 Tax=Pseudomonas sp. JDS28PS106 TaxID=2497235 RepID=UPI002FD3B9BF
MLAMADNAVVQRHRVAPVATKVPPTGVALQVGSEESSDTAVRVGGSLLATNDNAVVQPHRVVQVAT